MLDDLAKRAQELPEVLLAIHAAGGPEAEKTLLRLAARDVRRGRCIWHLVVLDPTYARRFWKARDDRRVAASTLGLVEPPESMAPFLAEKLKHAFGARGGRSRLLPLVRTIPSWPPGTRRDMLRWLRRAYDNIEEDRREYAALAIALLDESPRGMEPLVAELAAHPSDPGIIGALETFGTRSAPAAPRLRAIASDDSVEPWARIHALATLWKVAPEPELVPTALSLSDEDKLLRDDRTLELLGRLGNPARSLLGRIRVTRVSAPLVSDACSASRALVALGEDHALSHLASVLVRDTEPAIEHAMDAIRDLGEDGRELAPWVRTAVRQPDVDFLTRIDVRRWLAEG